MPPISDWGLFTRKVFIFDSTLIVKMKGRAAYGSATVFLLMVSILLDGLGLLWIFVGLWDNVSKTIIKGTVILLVGFGIGAVANFLK